MKFLVLVPLLALIACSSKKAEKKEASSESSIEQVTNTLQLYGDSDQNTAGALKTVPFDLDSFQIYGDARNILDENADYLKKNPSIYVSIEGHCDERGGIQYNLSLGEKRAKMVVDYLKSQGVLNKRMTTKSYGKEKPIDFGHDEESYSKNRRATFVIMQK